MNIYQRVTLVLGAVVLVLFIAPLALFDLVPRLQVVLLVRLAIVLSVTGLVWLALHGVRPNLAAPRAGVRTGLTRLYLVLCLGWLGYVLLWQPLVVGADTYRWFADQPVQGVLALLGLPAGLYALSWAILAIARWVDRGFKGD